MKDNVICCKTNIRVNLLEIQCNGIEVFIVEPKFLN